MAQHVCPVWVGYLLLNPLRKLLENPERLLAPFITPGMTVLEPGCGMGFFTLPMARLVGASGKVVVVDLQETMLAKLRRRARRAGVDEVIETRLAQGDSLGVSDLGGQVDFAAAIHVIHELPNQELFFAEAYQALKPGGRLLAMEPKGHVTNEDFERSLALARRAGFVPDPQAQAGGGRQAVLQKQADGRF
ncbi:methyltransferase type 11 [Desulfocarbo indianensis]|nr:methyltransferase type 11 [Desulfocarbo indianensis]